MNKAERIIVAMSGGVDSSVAALLLVRQGLGVEGLFMTNWEEDEQGYCTAARDFQDARRVCAELSIPLHKVDFAREYRERVFQYFLDEYSAGRTPNPDVLCNREIKFGVFLEYARRLGGSRIATGHYARLVEREGQVRLLRAKDPDKDQTYFLHSVPRSALEHALFPIGDLRKSEVRALAKEHGLVTHAKKDSTGICFIGERDFAAFLSRFLPARPGPIRTPGGEHLGIHRGLMFYTLGQRQGLGIGGRAGAGGDPWYVAQKDLDENALVVVQGQDHPLLFAETLQASHLSWLNGPPEAFPFRCTAKTRYRQGDRPCTITSGQDGRIRVQFDRPQRAMTPGQYIVFYRGEECLGGGVIDCVGPSASRSALAPDHSIAVG